MKRATCCAVVSLLAASTASAAPLPRVFSRKFTGTIGTHPIALSLTRVRNTLSGSYRYELGKVRLFLSYAGLSLQGQVDAQGAFTLREEATDDEGETTPSGKLTGTMALDGGPDGPITLRGTWSKADGSKPLPFGAREHLPIAAEARIVPVTRREPERLFKQVVEAVYPAVRDPRQAADRSFNSDVERLVQAQVRQYKDVVREYDALRSRRGHFQLDLSYDLAYADERIISIDFTIDSDANGAHPSREKSGYVFDRVRGKRATLGDLFRPTVPYRKTLAAITAKVLPGPEEDFSNFYLSDSGTWFVFSAGHAQGDYLSVYVPYGELRAIIDPAGPLGPLLAGKAGGP
jgi:hypothetical protein